MWAGKAKNYYHRSVEGGDVFRVVTTQRNPKNTLVRAGKPFNFKFLTSNAVGSPVFAFLNLPDTLNGDVYSGVVTGTFGVAGIYTLGVESAAQAGHTAEENHAENHGGAEQQPGRNLAIVAGLVSKNHLSVP